MWPLSTKLYSLLSNGSAQERGNCLDITEKILTGNLLTLSSKYDSNALAFVTGLLIG